MKLKLTSTKTIDINFATFGGRSKASNGDLVGVELFSSAPYAKDGVPAVHIYRKKNVWHLGAAAFVSSPEGALPTQWEDTMHQPTWLLPHAFQAPGAAISVNSDMGFFGQSSAEAIIRDMQHGLDASESTSAMQDSGKKRFGIKKSSAFSSAPQVKTDASRRMELPPAGIPVSENGRRFVVKPFAEDGFYISASLPEFQSLWLSRLLPEGRRPTAVSIQLAEASLMASILAQPEYIERKGSLLAMLVQHDAIYFAGYKAGLPVLWRKFPGANGYLAMRQAVNKTLGVGDDLVTPVLEESLVDPRPALEPFLHPILDELELSRAYLSEKHSINTDRILLSGLPWGAKHWQKLAEETLKVELVNVDPFAGLMIDKGMEVKNPHDYIIALGAALAASEVES